MRPQQHDRSEAVSSPRIPAPLPDPVEAGTTLDGIVRDRVRRAAECYRNGQPGHAEYHLVRAALAYARHIKDAESADTFAEQRFVHVPGATS